MKQYIDQLLRTMRITANTAVILATIVAILLPGNMAVAQEFTTPTTEPPVSQRAFDSFLTATPWYDETAIDCTDPDATQSPTIPAGTLPDNIPPAWREVLNKAAAAKNTSVTLLAALYLTENGNEWRDFDRNWATSPSGARGPMQFLPGTWDGHKQDGNGDGVMDVMNVWDAVFAAADMIADMGAKPSSPLGTLEQPMTRGTQTYYGAAYNHGPGWAERTSPTMALSAINTETREYIMNIHALVSSGFTKKGKPAYADPHSVMKNPGSGAPAAGGTPSTGPTGALQCCNTTPTGGSATIVIDPGHSGSTITNTDATGLIDQDYYNQYETEDAFAIAQDLKGRLGQAGYNVILTKASEKDSVSLRKRAETANAANAALAVSIHTQSNLPFASANNIVYAQKVGQYRQTPEGKKITFDLAEVAAKSQQYANTFLAERGAAEGHSVKLSLDATGDIGTRLPSPGSIWMVMLFSKVPWIYNEAGGKSADRAGGLNDTDRKKYADGLYNSITKAVPLTSGSTATVCTSTDGNNVTGNKAADLALDLAWPDTGHGKYKKDAKPIYVTTNQTLYGSPTETDFYSDCGVFVSTVVRSSGLDPHYPARGTYDQLPYLKKASQSAAASWTEIKTRDTGQLQPGDVFVFDTYPGGPGHTYIVTKKPGDHFLARSASFHSHVPQATGISWTQDQGKYTFSIFRKNAPGNGTGGNLAQ